ncbi:MAG TPA: lysylphosphatidylglycerol synthase transmembrane domain-containing protein [Solirubrobacterales bacterium]|nr:lysylphosphatidylglycerol synthase transmembrane domain-containing protein [Solirubrobacterales bacterium]
MIADLDIADLGASLDHFVNAGRAFFEGLADIAWGYLAAALVLYLVLQLARAHGWANALRAAYPGRRVSETGIAASFLIGAGINGILPARAGDAVKIVLAKRTVERSSYPTVLSSFGALAPFDSAIGVLVVIYAITQGLLPSAPRIPHLPAFEISYWAAHPQALLLLLTLLGIGLIAVLSVLARRVESFWAHLKQGLAIFREPARYVREVAAWQLVGWLCRFASFWLFLDAFGIGGSFQNVLLVMSVQSITGALPFTPGGAGAQQALLVATLHGAPRTLVLAYSVGQQIAITAWSVAVAFLSLIYVFRTSDWRRLVREGQAARAGAGAK